jgi:hypothetical protein
MAFYLVGEEWAASTVRSGDEEMRSVAEKEERRGEEKRCCITTYTPPGLLISELIMSHLIELLLYMICDL